MGMLINIDNGGTLTDICVIDGERVYRTKTLTTPYDLSKCFFEGIKKASEAVYGQEDVQTLLLSTDHIRYSTTQGTNALVERKGPRLGIVSSGTLNPEEVRSYEDGADLFDALVGSRIAHVDLDKSDGDLEVDAVRAVSQLASVGANRLIVAHGGSDRFASENRIKDILLQKFPQHLLGSIPVLYSHEVVEDEDDARRTWTALFNAFLHPAMERFLYSAEHKLRAHKVRNPLLIFRNDGHSARVAKTIALKTYSSGPRGGMEGAKALAAHYGLSHLLTMDIGGTTTDIGEVNEHDVRVDRRGKVENVATSFPLCNVISVGVGGSSIIKADGKGIEVGPESVGSAPGPACFGLGGSSATITDAFLLLGLIDPSTYFGGALKIDAERARAAIATNVADPLGISPEEAARCMEAAWVTKVADSLMAFTAITPDTTLAAFGGAGPFVTCKVAEAAGISRVLIPGLAAVFSAFGLGFSDIQHQYEAPLRAADNESLKVCIDGLVEQATRGMFAEGFALKDCEITKTLRVTSDAGEERSFVLTSDTIPDGVEAGASLSVTLEALRRISRPQLRGALSDKTVEAKQGGVRTVLFGKDRIDAPLYKIEEQPAGASAMGPAVLEEAFFTCRLDTGWRFSINESGDVLLTRA
ncbi:hydantoinase/oxoprolinase family protein [Burkholderia multivorans]|uniref:hydantoinase/oxoprolinase family protein n=1 Tax=Burkholderia multivorans TaxID=87883 RepID=UPI0004F69AF5|nr:hydantoinase/oxoprolinase family protein [Burkholderia multivorans]AIO72525.1 hydantoinase/oxoprolinase family protein [Burkholderia multivorans]